MKQQNRKTIHHFNDPGHAHFLTFSCYQQLPLLRRERTRHWFVQAVVNAKVKHSFPLLGYVIMPEHVHLVLHPAEETRVGEIVGEIKRSSALQIHQILLAGQSDLEKRLTVVRNGASRFVFWQRRCYDHNCRSEASTWEKVEYCHSNPVNRGLVSSPEDWYWSSYRWYQGKRDVVLEMNTTDIA